MYSDRTLVQIIDGYNPLEMYCSFFIFISLHLYQGVPVHFWVQPADLPVLQDLRWPWCNGWVIPWPTPSPSLLGTTDTASASPVKRKLRITKSSCRAVLAMDYTVDQKCTDPADVHIFEASNSFIKAASSVMHVTDEWGMSFIYLSTDHEIGFILQ